MRGHELMTGKQKSAIIGAMIGMSIFLMIISDVPKGGLFDSNKGAQGSAQHIKVHSLDPLPPALLDISV